MNEFTLDTGCGNTLVAVKKGSVELRAGSTVKQIAAGWPGYCRHSQAGLHSGRRQELIAGNLKSREQACLPDLECSYLNG